MDLNLTSEDSRRLRATLDDYLPALRREVAATDERSLRHELAQRQELLERLVDKLSEMTERSDV